MTDFNPRLEEITVVETENLTFYDLGLENPETGVRQILVDGTHEGKPVRFLTELSLDLFDSLDIDHTRLAHALDFPEQHRD